MEIIYQHILTLNNFIGDERYISHYSGLTEYTDSKRCTLTKHEGCCECSKLNKKKSILYMIMTLMYRDISLKNLIGDCKYPKRHFLLKTIYYVYDTKILTYIYPKDIHIYTKNPPGKSIIFNLDDMGHVDRYKTEQFRLNKVRSHYQSSIRVYVYRYYDNLIFKNRIVEKCTNVRDGVFDLKIFYNDDEKISSIVNEGTNDRYKSY